MGANEDGRDITVGMLNRSENRNVSLVQDLVMRINEVYRTAELGMWRDGAERTSAAEVADLIAAGQLALAHRDAAPVGSVQITDVAAGTTRFGMLVADPGHRGVGIGRALVDFAERRSRARGRGVMQLELLVPRTWQHPHKEFLKAWYSRLGYRLVRTTAFDETYPHLTPLLATDCDLTIYQKPLLR